MRESRVKRTKRIPSLGQTLTAKWLISFEKRIRIYHDYKEDINRNTHGHTRPLLSSHTRDLIVPSPHR